MTARQDAAQAVMGYNAKFHQTVAFRLCGKLVNATIIQIYDPPPDAEEDETERFYATNWEEIHHASKSDMFLIIGCYPMT